MPSREMKTLRMLSSEPNNSTHVVNIHLKEGFGLGEIKSLEKFELVSMPEAKKVLRVKTGERGSHVLDHQGGDNAMVVFSGDKIYRVLCVNLELGQAKAPLLTVEESDQKATAGFCALSRVKLPSVHTPSLH
jgi:hypothetical protein